MPRDSSGAFTLAAGNPVVSDTLIEVNWANPTLADIAQALTESLDRYGRGAMLAPLPFMDGTQASPAITFGAESSTGFYRPASGALGISIQGNERARFTSSGFLIGSTIANLAASGRGLFEINGAIDAVIGLKVGDSLKAYLHTDASGSLTFNVNGIQALTIDPTGVISGDGSALTNIDASNLVGLIPLENLGDGAVGDGSHFLADDQTWKPIATPIVVTSFNTRTGAVLLNSLDVIDALGFTPIQRSDTFSSALAGTVPASGGGANKYLNADGTWSQPIDTGRLIKVTVFTIANTGQIFNPDPQTKSVIVEAVGGGGGSGGTVATSAGNVSLAGAGGGAAYGMSKFTSGFSGVVLTIGAGGAGAAPGANGGTGGTTSFGALLSCPGGKGGASGFNSPSANSIANGVSAAGAPPTGANIKQQNGSNPPPSIYNATGGAYIGAGGSTPLGSGTTGSGSVTGSGYGSGASGFIVGASVAAQGGVVGAPGAIIVWEYA